MSLAQTESIKMLSREITHGFLAERQIILDNIERLTFLIQKTPNKKNVKIADEEKEADLRHSNTRASKNRREQIYIAQITSAEREIKYLTAKFIQFIQQQRELLALKERDENRSLKGKKDSENTNNFLNENQKKRLAQLLNDLDKLSKETTKITSMLKDLIKNLEYSINNDNKTFITNFQATVRSDLEKLGTVDGDNSTVDEDNITIDLGSKKITLSINEIIEILTNSIKGEFEKISRDEPTSSAAERTRDIEAQVKDYIEEQAREQLGDDYSPADSKEHQQQIASQIVAIFENQSTHVNNHLAVNQAKQQMLSICKHELNDIVLKESKHLESMKEAAKDLDSLSVDSFLEDSEKCVETLKTTVKEEAASVSLMPRMGLTLEALDKVVSANQAPQVPTAEKRETLQVKFPSSSV